MTTLLPTYLKLALEEPGPAEYKRIVSTIPRELGAWDAEGTLTPVRELLLSTKIESTTLVQTEMAATVREGSEFQKCLRNACQVIPMGANTLTIPYGESGSYAGEVAEGAEIPIATQDYNTVTFTAKKYGVRPMITQEMIDDALYPVIELEVRKAGQKMENKLNQLMLTELLGGAGNEQDTSGSNQGIKSIASAITLIKADGFIPDTIVMCPAFEAGIMAEYIPTGYVGAEAAQSGRLPNLLGLTPYTTSVAATTGSTYTWGYASDGNIGAAVFAKADQGGIGMRRDITVTQFADPARDLKGMTLTARWAVDTISADAVCRIEY